MFHILVLLVSWLTWGTVDLINTNAYSVSSSATMIEMTFEEYAHNQGVDDITLTNLIGNGDFIVLNNQTLKEVFEDGQLITNGDFSDGTTGWTASNSGTPSVASGIVSFTPTAQWGGIKANITTPLNSIVYYVAKVKSSSNYTRVFINDFVPNVVYHSGSGNYELLSYKSTIVLERQTIINIIILSTSSWTQIDVDYAYAYNLTTLGISNLSRTELDTLYSYYQAVKNNVSFGASNIDVIDDVSYYTNDLIILELGITPIYTQSQLDDIIAYYGYFEGEQTFLNINHTDFDTIYTEFFGTASTVFLDNYDTTAYIDLTTTYNDIDINDIGVMLIFLLGYLTVIHIVKEYL